MFDHENRISNTLAANEQQLLVSGALLWDQVLAQTTLEILAERNIVSRAELIAELIVRRDVALTPGYRDAYAAALLKLIGADDEAAKPS